MILVILVVFITNLDYMLIASCETREQLNKLELSIIILQHIVVPKANMGLLAGIV